MTVENTTGLLDPVELAEAIGALGQSTGYPLWGSRLALAQGNVAVAYRGHLEHRRLVNSRIVPRIDAAANELLDGISPEELLRRQTQLPTRTDSKGPTR